MKSIENQLKANWNQLKINWKSIEIKLKSIENKLKSVQNQLNINWHDDPTFYSDPGPQEFSHYSGTKNCLGGAYANQDPTLN